MNETPQTDSTLDSLSELNARIAELLGRRYHKPTEAEIASGSYYQYEPDFVHDLNACAEFEKGLSGTDWDERGMSSFMKYYAALCAECDMQPQMMIFATAEQRCRAFVAAMEASSPKAAGSVLEGVSSNAAGVSNSESVTPSLAPGESKILGEKETV